MSGFAPRTNRNRNAQEQVIDTLFCFPHDDTPHSVAHLYLIAWRFILTDFYQLKYNTELPPFDEARAYSWDALLRPTGAGLGACTRIFRHSAQPRKHLPSRTPIFPVAASPYYARAVVRFFPRLKVVLWWWRVEPALSSRIYLGCGLMRARESSAGDYIGGQLPVWHCFHGFRAFRLELWLFVLRLCDSSERGAQALAGALCSKTVVTDWLSGNAEAVEVALWLTMLPCDDSRWRFGDAWMSMTVSFGSEAEGAARASAGNCSMLTQK
eukprot:scaffold1232_cov127-Isochrysis_galbana.AAC.9